MRDFFPLCGTGAERKPGSVEQHIPIFRPIRRKTHFDLLLGILLSGERRKTVLRKVSGGSRLQVCLELPADGGAEHKDLAHAIGIEGEVVFCPVLDRDDSVGGHLQARLLPDLLDRIFTQVSKEYLRIPEAENEYFFRAQKEIYEKFNEPYFSYSAPTSLGKSYIMRTFIREQIAKGRQCNFAIIVPTKALINETTEKLTEVLGPELKEKNYRIVTSAGAMALEEEHNFIFAMTPERLLYLLILMKDIPIEYLFIDEAHKISKKDGRSAFYYKVVDMLSQRSTPPHIIFASPNIPNPEVYLQLIPDVANRENYKIATKFSPVNQEKFLIDFKRFELHYYNEATQKLTKYCSFPEDKGLLDFVRELGEGARSIVYSNSKDNVVEYALQYAAQLQPLHDSDLDVLAQDIRQDVHGDYYLADIVEKAKALVG